MEERRKNMSKSDETGRREYRRLNNKLRRETENPCEKWLRNECEQIEKLNEIGRYDLSNGKILISTWCRRGKSCSGKDIKDENGKVLHDERQVIRRWKKYIEHIESLKEVGEVNESKMGAPIRDVEVNKCWENCQLLQANFPVWGGVCSEPEICFPGCQEACQFHRDISPIQQSVPVIQTRGEEVIYVKNHTAYWPQPSRLRHGDSHDEPLIYVVMRRSPGKMWKQITQTLDMSSRVPDDLTSGAMLRVLVVDQDGLLTIYSPVASESTLRSANDIAKSSGRKGIGSLYTKTSEFTNKSESSAHSRRINTEIGGLGMMEDNTHPVAERTSWNLREISMIHQKVLVIAEVGWDAVPSSISTKRSVAKNRDTDTQPRPVYYVTWEVDGGGLKGNLFTDSTCVTLSLWPDTVYHIQVELVDHSIKTGRAQQSEDFLLDTHRAIAVELDTPSPDEIEPSLSPSISNTVEVHHVKAHKVNVLSDHQQYEVLFAVGAAFVVFLVVLIVLIYASCRHSDILLYPRSNMDIFSLKPENKKSQDISHFPKEFMPVLTLVSDNISSRCVTPRGETHERTGQKYSLANSQKADCVLPLYSKPIIKFENHHSAYSFPSSRKDSLYENPVSGFNI